MRYLKVAWRHSSPDDPVLLYSELNDQRWENRSIEIFQNGKVGYASADTAFGGTELGLAPVPSLEEINADAQFEACEISSVKFEEVWKEATT